MEEFDANRSKHLYRLWNRMASGSYFPPPTKEVEILKKDGKARKLGIPTISDRVGQMVVKEYLEPRFEKIFSPHSYGYRPEKNAHQALEAVRANCRKTDWVIDLDIKRSFDNIDHDRLLKAVDKHVSEKRIKLYIRRWLQMPILDKSGELIKKQLTFFLAEADPEEEVTVSYEHTGSAWLSFEEAGAALLKSSRDVLRKAEVFLRRREQETPEARLEI